MQADSGLDLLADPTFTGKPALTLPLTPMSILTISYLQLILTLTLTLTRTRGPGPVPDFL